MSASKARDVNLLDVLEAINPVPFSGVLWRVVREGRDPLVGSAVGGRWDDKTFDVLYTSTKPEGAIAEMHFHVSRGQPVIPSRVNYTLFEIAVEMTKCVDFPTLDHLSSLGLRTETYGQLSYDERHDEYPRTQEIAEAVYFLGNDGLSVPNARFPTQNVVVYTERVASGNLSMVKNHGIISWTRWREGGYKF